MINKTIHNTYYHRIVKGLQAHFLLSSTAQVSMLSKVWFTNAQCTYWNKNQVKDVLKYLCIESKERLFFQSEMFPFGFWSFQSCRFGTIHRQKTKEILSLLLFWSFFLFFTCWTFPEMNWHNKQVQSDRCKIPISSNQPIFGIPGQTKLMQI